MLYHSLMLLIGFGYLVEGQDLGVGSISQADPLFPEGTVENSDGVSPFLQAEAAPSVFVKESSRSATYENSFQQAKVPSTSKDELRVVANAPKKKKKKKRKGKKKKMRKVKVKPRGGRHIKDTYQDLRSWSRQNTDGDSLQTTTQTVVIFDPIYDKSTGGYTQEELLKLCHETENVSAKFGITDMSSFAGSNCALIQLYYPEVTCEQINVFLEYCQKANAHA